MSKYENILEVKNLKTYFHTLDGTVKAVDDISFYLKKGESIGLVGESGCGKSVTALSIMKLIRPPGEIIDGQIFFNDTDLLTLSSKKLQGIRGKNISMIFQEPFVSLNPLFSIGNQISEVLTTHYNMKEKEALEKAAHLLDAVGIPSPKEKLNEYPFHLSGGMCQRAMIAMALACEPRIIIADEPTTALDVTIQAQILELLRSKKEEFNTSLLLITHDLGIIAETVDRVVIMYAGKIVESGSVKSIFREPLHPYTQGLLASIPSPDISRSVKPRLDAIEGVVPELTNLPEGCSFATRCHYAEKICKMREPVLKTVKPEYEVRCWKY